MKSAYEKFPVRAVQGGTGAAFAGWGGIAAELAQAAARRLAENSRCVVVVDCYPCTDLSEVLVGLSTLGAGHTVVSDSCALSAQQLDSKLADTLTDDRVFGVMSTGMLSSCFDAQKIARAQQEIAGITSGIVLVYGVGAALITQGDILVCADLSRWEIQLRWRAGQSNWHTDNGDAPILAKYKRGFFAEWRFADKHKRGLFARMDYFLETNRPGDPAMVTGAGFCLAMQQSACEPFRTVPYFDPGVWGGQWMKRVCGLDEAKDNFAWSFDGVPEENSLLLSFDGTILELPAIDLVLTQPRALLGERVYARFGAEFPIRFDLLDTMGGQNLSLQVHPLTEYIQEHFNMRYTQDESYYILDAAEDAYVYLGTKTDIDPAAMMGALRDAEGGGKPFPADEFVNRFAVSKHDHVLIPAGTVHCSGKDTMVLEISATPYIFTFKLWDWGRLGLDGLPRPTHLAHGEQNIQWSRNTEWTEQNLLHREQTLVSEPGCTVERTGLHELEFIDTFRYTLQRPCRVATGGSVNVWNLVGGTEAEVTSPTGAFRPFTVHYAETFIIPAAVGEYEIGPCGESSGKEIVAIMAMVH